MLQINKSILYYNDENYTHAVNYQYMYNAPITLNYGEKHNRTKYIISSGNCDNITLMQDGIFIYVVSENSGLDYIAMQVINTELKTIEGNVYLYSDDINDESAYSYDILNMDIDKQIKILSEYL